MELRVYVGLTWFDVGDVELRVNVKRGVTWSGRRGTKGQRQTWRDVEWAAWNEGST